MTAPHRDETRELLKIWRRFRGEKRLPSQNDIRMEELEEFLPNLFILDIEAPDRFILKMMGAAIIPRMGGHDMTGMNMLDLSAPDFRERMVARVRMIFKFGYAACTHTRLASLDGRMKRTENLMLPVEKIPGGRRQVFGLIRYTDGLDEAAVHDADFTGIQILEESFIDLGSGYAAVIDAGELPFSAFPGKEE